MISRLASKLLSISENGGCRYFPIDGARATEHPWGFVREGGMKGLLFPVEALTKIPLSIAPREMESTSTPSSMAANMSLSEHEDAQTLYTAK